MAVASAELEPIERASTAELRALQLERLQWSLRHAYENVAHYRRSFDAAGVRPDDLRSLDDAVAICVTPEAALAVHVKRAMGAVFSMPSSLELEAEQTFSKPDNLVDVVSRF